MIPLSTRPRRAARVGTDQRAGELVVFHLPNARFANSYSLNELGARIWALCDGTHSISEIASVISEEYEAPGDQVRDDVVALLEQLASEHLVEDLDSPGITP
jgi:hypothetical protein